MSAPCSVGDVIAGKYRVERVLGAGGMGVVVEATHLALDEKVAIKFLKPEALVNTAAVARFAREARAAAKIKSEHVVRVLDVVVDAGVPYLVMEHLEGEDLDVVIEKEGALSVEDAVDYVLQACEALAEAHVAGIVHRDLKPANLYLARRADGSPCVKVLDFGISKIAPKAGSSDAAVTATSSLLGSPIYMSPEQMKVTRDVDARTDLWSMGIILYELLTARQPFCAETIPQVCALVLSEPAPTLGGSVPAGLEAVVMKCLEKRAEDRYQSVAELAEALRAFAPARSVVSIERIVKVVRARASGGALPTSRSAVEVAPLVPRNSIVSADAVSETLPADAVGDLRVPLPQPARTAGSVSGTHGTFESVVAPRPARVGRWAVAAAAGALAVAAATALVFTQRAPTTVTSPAAARPSPAPVEAPLPSASPPSTPAPALPAPPSAEAAPPSVAAASANSPAPARPAARPKVAPKAPSTAPQASAPQASAPQASAPPKPAAAPPAFGGRD